MNHLYIFIQYIKYYQLYKLVKYKKKNDFARNPLNTLLDLVS